MDKLNWGKRAYTVFLLCATTAIALPAQTFTTLHSFDNTNGAFPNQALVQGTDGNFYGATEGGGNTESACGASYSDTCGTIFKIAPDGTLTTLYSFCAQSDCADGSQPNGGLVQAANGNFYGTTLSGGTSNNCQPIGGGLGNGCGTVFQISPAGSLTTLHSFGSTDGSYPEVGLGPATNGYFYGTTDGGGINGNFGTVFKITPQGTLTTLHSFDGTDGLFPSAALVQATNGYFYGTTYAGGANDNPLCEGNGTIGCGTVFQISPGGTLTTIYNFCSQSNCADGAAPFAGVVQATDGNLYGATAVGGASGYGTVFKITPAGTLTTLHSFSLTDGAYPYASLVQGTDGNLYGTTLTYGANGYGTVFSLGVGLAPFVETRPTSGAISAIVVILGNNLTGATRVTFNGRAARFEVVSSSEILTTVPTGATTGIVQVMTPSGTLNSNVAFQVTAPTTTTLVSSQNPSIYGEVVTFTAEVSSSAGAPPDGETVAFLNGATLLGAATLSGGTASFTTSALPVGTNSVTAVYNGSAEFAGSTSNTVRELVDRARTSTTLTSSPGPFVFGLPVTFTAKVTSMAGAPPDGETVTFERGTAKLGTGTLSGGEANFTTSALPVGTDSVTAVYGGDANLAGSRSTIAISVIPPATVSVRGSGPVDFWPNPQYWTVSVTNKGPGVAYNVRLASATVNGIGGSWSRSGDFGNLAQGQSLTITVTGGGQLLPCGLENVELDTVTWTGGSSTFRLAFVTSTCP